MISKECGSVLMKEYCVKSVKIMKINLIRIFMNSSDSLETNVNTKIHEHMLEVMYNFEKDENLINFA